MKYFVLWHDGRKFGPADLETLTQWATEGRIQADTILESDADGSTTTIGELGIAVAAPQVHLLPPVTEHAPPTEQSRPTFEIPEEYPMGGGSPYPIESYYAGRKSDTSVAWGLIIGGFVAMFVFSCFCAFLSVGSLGLTGAGIYHANKGKRNGEPGAQAAFVVGIVAISFQALVLIAGAVFLMSNILRSF